MVSVATRRRQNPIILAPRGRSPAPAQVGQDRENAPMIIDRPLKTELHEDLTNVRFDSLGAQEEGGADPSIRSTLGDQRQDFKLALGQVPERIRITRPLDEPGDDRRVQDRLTFADPAKRVGQRRQRRIRAP